MEGYFPFFLTFFPINPFSLLTPERVGGYLVRAGASSGSSSGTGEEKEHQKPVEVISELGIFGWALFSGRQVESGIEMKEKEGEGGWWDEEERGLVPLPLYPRGCLHIEGRASAHQRGQLSMICGC